MKIKLPLEKFYHLINHGPCCLITSGNDKIKNIAPIAWITPLNDDPPLVIVCIASSHYTAELINKYREFVINVPSIKLLDAIKQTGKTSGREIDKFNLVKLTAVDGIKVKVVHIDESIGFIESKVVDSKEYDGVILFIGRVVHCEVEESFYDKYLLTDKAKTIHHVGGNKFFVSTKAI
ncbi:MAG: flavin reductase family protein [Elusimicrobiota bacterium]|nr:flavin reductase family protein [Endomicrobiia bacterium]MDW8055268.1 flavin reductase family protein [Elusimicrobiota bacterium]